MLNYLILNPLSFPCIFQILVALDPRVFAKPAGSATTIIQIILPDVSCILLWRFSISLSVYVVSTAVSDCLALIFGSVVGLRPLICSLIICLIDDLIGLGGSELRERKEPFTISCTRAFWISIIFFFSSAKSSNYIIFTLSLFILNSFSKFPKSFKASYLIMVYLKCLLHFLLVDLIGFLMQFPQLVNEDILWKLKQEQVL